LTIAPVALWRYGYPWWKNLANLLKRIFNNRHAVGLNWFSWIYGASSVPVLFYSRKDHPTIPSRNFDNLTIAKRIFIRELPQNRWNLFLNTGPKNEDVINLQRNKHVVGFLAKIQPLALGLATERVFIEPGSIPKTVDLFYAGKNHTSTVREKGILLLKKMKELGYRVDIPEEYLSQEEYDRRVSQAQLVWSPEGQGWDCYRHYEALALGSVPVINYPTIERDHPLIEGKQAFFYSIEGDHLINVICRALENPEKLKEMVQAGQKHINQYHRPTVLVQKMINETLSLTI